jgi:hypothetical protein
MPPTNWRKCKFYLCGKWFKPRVCNLTSQLFCCRKCKRAERYAEEYEQLKRWRDNQPMHCLQCGVTEDLVWRNGRPIRLCVTCRTFIAKKRKVV